MTQNKYIRNTDIRTIGSQSGSRQTEEAGGYLQSACGWRDNVIASCRNAMRVEVDANTQIKGFENDLAIEQTTYRASPLRRCICACICHFNAGIYGERDPYHIHNVLWVAQKLGCLNSTYMGTVLPVQNVSCGLLRDPIFSLDVPILISCDTPLVLVNACAYYPSPLSTTDGMVKFITATPA